MIRVGITIGDPAGIGPEITCKALRRISCNRAIEFFVIGEQQALKRAGGLPRAKNITLITCPGSSSARVPIGKVSAEAGRASIEYIRRAVTLLEASAIDCLVTCPISKEAVHKAGFDIGGHTELLAAATGSSDPLMLLVNTYLKFSLVTRHIALRDVARSLTAKKIRSTVEQTRCAMREFFGFRSPRICVAAVNPHASDGGIMGDEEYRIIKPALRGMPKSAVFGPLSADSAAMKLKNNEYDCCVAMYHDQALIPLKVTDVASGVNLTYGLPFVRTSPLHGTAFDIAGKGVADPSSLIAAIELAERCAQHKKRK